MNRLLNPASHAFTGRLEAVAAVSQGVSKPPRARRSRALRRRSAVRAAVGVASERCQLLSRPAGPSGRRNKLAGVVVTAVAAAAALRAAQAPGPPFKIPGGYPGNCCRTAAIRSGSGLLLLLHLAATVGISLRSGHHSTIAGDVASCRKHGMPTCSTLSDGPAPADEACAQCTLQDPQAARIKLKIRLSTFAEVSQ